MPPIRRDRDRFGGGIFIYNKEGMPLKELSLNQFTAHDMEMKALENKPTEN